MTPKREQEIRDNWVMWNVARELLAEIDRLRADYAEDDTNPYVIEIRHEREALRKERDALKTENEKLKFDLLACRTIKVQITNHKYNLQEKLAIAREALYTISTNLSADISVGGREAERIAKEALAKLEVKV